MANTKKKNKIVGAAKKTTEKKHKMKPTFANVTVTNGKAAPSPLTVAAGELIHFTNDDNQDYLIQLFVDDDDPTHPSVDVLLAALGDCRLMADPGAAGTQCTYNVVPTVLKNLGTAAGGGTHVIIITSGASTIAKAAAG